MKFGIHNSFWEPAEAFEAVKTKAQWAEAPGFAWFSVRDHIRDPRSGHFKWPTGGIPSGSNVIPAYSAAIRARGLRRWPTTIATATATATFWNWQRRPEEPRAAARRRRWRMGW